MKMGKNMVLKRAEKCETSELGERDKSVKKKKTLSGKCVREKRVKGGQKMEEKWRLGRLST